MAKSKNKGRDGNKFIAQSTKGGIAFSCILIAISDFLGILGTPNGLIPQDKIPSMILVFLGLIATSQIFESRSNKAHEPVSTLDMKEIIRSIEDHNIFIEALDTKEEIDAIGTYITNKAHHKIDAAFFGGYFQKDNTGSFVGQTPNTASLLMKKLKNDGISYRCILGYDNESYSTIVKYLSVRKEGFNKEKLGGNINLSSLEEEIT